jgi:hypothetical protein
MNNRLKSVLVCLAVVIGGEMLVQQTVNPSTPPVDFRSVAPLEEMHTKSEIRGWLTLHGMPDAATEAVLEHMRHEQVTSWDSADGKIIRIAVYMLLTEQNKTFKEVK